MWICPCSYFSHLPWIKQWGCGIWKLSRAWNSLHIMTMVICFNFCSVFFFLNIFGRYVAHWFNCWIILENLSCLNSIGSAFISFFFVFGYCLSLCFLACEVYEMKIEACHWTVAMWVYLSHLLGCTLFTNKSVTHVHVVFLDALCDMTQSGVTLGALLHLCTCMII